MANSESYTGPFSHPKYGPIEVFEEFVTSRYIVRFKDAVLVEFIIERHEIEQPSRPRWSAACMACEMRQYGAGWMELYKQERARLCPAS